MCQEVPRSARQLPPTCPHWFLGSEVRLQMFGVTNTSGAVTQVIAGGAVQHHLRQWLSWSISAIVLVISGYIWLYLYFILHVILDSMVTLFQKKQFKRFP